MYEEEEYTEKQDSLVRIRQLNIPQARKLVETVLKTDIVPFLWGPPGVGKSSLVKQIAEDNEYECIDLRLSLLNPVDLRGLPVVDRKTKTAEWLSPKFLPNDKTKKKGILFLDEINLAPPSVQAAAYQLILDKQLGEYKFPKHWRIVVAGNREIDKANVYKISAPLANRFIHFTIVADFQSWKLWAKDKIRPEILQFLGIRPAMLLQMPKDVQKAFPSPRTWEFMSNLLNLSLYTNEIGDELKQMIIATIGEGSGKEFIKFLGDFNIKDLSKVIDTFISGGEIKMPKKISMRFAVITAIYDAYISQKIDKKRFEEFKKNLNSEEKRTVDEFEQKNSGKIKEKYKKTPQIDLSIPPMTLISSIDTTDKQLRLSSTNKINHKGNLIISSGAQFENVSYTSKNTHGVSGLKRGRFSTPIQAWSAGSLVYKVK